MDYSKLMSGKFLFTAVTGIVFLYAVYTKLLTNEQVHAIIILVISFYFNKRSDHEDIGDKP
jgi:hypothetical protein